METPQVLLDHHLKALRLPTFLRVYDKVAQQCAAEGGRVRVRFVSAECVCFRLCGLYT